MSKYGVYVGRMNPLHVGHEAVIKEMISMHGIARSLVVIGSANAMFSLRHFFSYTERRCFIKKVFPEMTLAGLPDFGNDDDWLIALDDLICLRGFDPRDVTFFGGCEEDIIYFTKAGRKCHIINRFDGTTPKISATEVRDCLIYDRSSVDDMINALIADDVKKTFRMKWEQFKKM